MPIEIPPVVEPAPIPGESNAYCTDEDIAIETNDFPNLVPRDQIDAFGDAATISRLAPWDLVDPAADFVANGVRPASLVYLTKPEEIWGADPGEVFAVAAINPTDIRTLTLRRIGRAAGLGEPPGFRDRDIVAITYTIKTMLMQIQEATSEIDRDFGISKFLAAAGNIVPEDWQKINRMCVYKTMYKRYLSLSRTTTAPGAMDVWLVKSDRYRAFYDSEAGSLTLASAGGATSAPNKKYKRIQRI